MHFRGYHEKIKTGRDHWLERKRRQDAVEQSRKWTREIAHPFSDKTLYLAELQRLSGESEYGLCHSGGDTRQSSRDDRMMEIDGDDGDEDGDGDEDPPPGIRPRLDTLSDIKALMSKSFSTMSVMFDQKSLGTGGEQRRFSSVRSVDPPPQEAGLEDVSSSEDSSSSVAMIRQTQDYLTHLSHDDRLVRLSMIEHQMDTRLAQRAWDKYLLPSFLAEELREMVEEALGFSSFENAQQPTSLQAWNVPLTKAQDTRVKAVLFQGSESDVVVSKYNVELRRRDIRTLDGLTWLNDEVMNFWVSILADHFRRTSQHFYNSFFYSKLTEHGTYTYANVRRWARKFDIFALDRVLMPIHLGNTHWALAVMYVQKRVIRFYDSMHGRGKVVMDHLFHYLKDEHQDKKKSPLPHQDKWHLEAYDETPAQMNGCDCGVFSSSFNAAIAAGVPTSDVHAPLEHVTFHFSQQDMPNMRQYMIWRILQGTLVDSD